MNRREFLGAAAATALSSNNLLGPDSASKLANDPRRPQFHFLPEKNWMNDPNGPIYWNGKYHMFCQFNPHGAVWGNMSWYHSVSPDMVHWTHLPLAMEPTPGGPDAFGVFSGTAIGKGKRVYFVYTGTVKATFETATLRDGNSNLLETQCLAWSDDPKLVTWQKAKEPILPSPPRGMKVTGFRDPSVWRQGDWYYMTVGSGTFGVGGSVLLYRSPAVGDLRQWEYMHQLTSGTWNGKKSANACDTGEMWECPDFFALDEGHLLIYSTEGKVFWQSGVLDAATMKFTPKKTGLLDLDAFYAPKTQLDAQRRRILWGWVPERRSDDAMRQAGWSGMMSLPRVLRLDQDGTLRMEVLPELAKLRQGSIGQSESRAGDLRMLDGASGEVVCAGTAGTSFAVQVSLDQAALMALLYSGETHSFMADGHEIKLQPGDAPVVHLFVDGSVLEVVVAGRIGYTRRFYYDSATAPAVRVLATGKPDAISAWKIAPISGNRLTTQG
jgi:beta-fructofuranosidase